ncbi:MAG: phytanoyl-CoA dioxygenase family protein [Planctomycetota bacterium]|nr:phytanoyl-CoA dioxygenase family protein [Planctomycetota bacterium]
MPQPLSPAPLSPAPLTPAQFRHFHDEGYLVADHVFTDADLQPVIDEINHEVTARAEALVKEGKLSRTFQELGFEHQLGAISRETDQLAMSIWNGVLNGPAIFNLIRHSALLDIAEQLCGPELIGSSVYRLRPKIPNHRMGPVPWHQDSGYFEPYCDKSLVLTVWLPLIDATPENGCLWVAPRAHRQGVVRHVQVENKPYLHILSNDLPHEPRNKPVCVPVKKGSVLLLTNLSPHASYENKTDLVRWSMDLRYQSASLPTNAPITRLEGDSVPTGDGLVPTACYPPEADFLVRSRLRPSEVVTDPAEFERIRNSHRAGGLSRKWDNVPAYA